MKVHWRTRQGRRSRGWESMPSDARRMRTQSVEGSVLLVFVLGLCGDADTRSW